MPATALIDLIEVYAPRSFRRERQAMA